ncbi:MAG: NAD(P)/FAD-dependent oxidoreductase [Thermoplasmatales archaeon]|nr:NAD(P)/FAD-dependent oxidoreductase [Thermoplasmatales archaeon]MCW6170950.1 NAD(P)/FAD-dependent oxidoreductase [Thermoplasmatales archaeon]
MEHSNIVIIGGGIVGLAIAAELSTNNEGIFVFDKNKMVGMETSSHNSGVIHSGIHYPRGTLKARLAVEGNRMIYELCNEYNIPFKKLGKLTVANNENEIIELERLMKNGEDNNVENLKYLDKEEIRSMEPNIEAQRAIYSPSTGIVEPFDLINLFYRKAVNNQAEIVTNTEVSSIRKVDSEYELTGLSSGEPFTLRSKTVINCAGLHSDEVAAMIGLDVNKLGYKIQLCKGDYFRINGAKPVRIPVYPVPSFPGLGIHLTPDLSGSVRMGPNAYYVDSIDYRVESDKNEFTNSVRNFMPSIDKYDISPDSSGIRPQIKKDKSGFKDFIIAHEVNNDLFGFFNLIGIESPGLTSAPAIGKYVSEMYETEIKS